MSSCAFEHARVRVSTGAFARSVCGDLECEGILMLILKKYFIEGNRA